MKERILFKLLLLLLSIHTVQAHEFPYEPPKNFTLNPKFIVLHHPVSTDNITAQLLFDQGLTLLYAFNHDAAYWSFKRAAEFDPNLAMAYWGMALALGSNINMEITLENAKVAYETVQKAMQLSKNASQPEKDYIEALSQRYDKNPKERISVLAKKYLNAMRNLAQKYPDDTDASTLFAESILTSDPWNQWEVDGTPREGTLEAVSTLENVLRKDPNHLGANHYYIHAVEASNHPERALMSAERLKTLMPSSGHILHMPSHIYILVGDYHNAALSNEQAVAVDRQYIREYGLDGIYPVHYLSHNLYFLSRAYGLEGRYDDAKRTADELFELYAPHFHQMEDLEYYIPPPMLVLIRFHKWKEILEIPKPSDDLKVTIVLWHFSRAMAFARLGNFEEAEKEKQLFLSSQANVSPNSAFGYNKSQAVFLVAGDVLNAQIAEAQGKFEDAQKYYEEAIHKQDVLHYNEPPDWFYPIRESLGGLLLRAKKYPEAEKVFRDDLNIHPRNGRSLFGLKESLLAQKKMHDYYFVNQQFEQAWLYSDTTLSVESL